MILPCVWLEDGDYKKKYEVEAHAIHPDVLPKLFNPFLSRKQGLQNKEINKL